jgi:hypothetical protein
LRLGFASVGGNFILGFRALFECVPLAAPVLALAPRKRFPLLAFRIVGEAWPRNARLFMKPRPMKPLFLQLFLAAGGLVDAGFGPRGRQATEGDDHGPT